MDVCHVLLGRPWQYDMNFIHGGRINTYTLDKNGRTQMLLPIEEKKVKDEASMSILLMSGKEQEMQFVVVMNPRFILTSTSMEYFPKEVQELLENFVDIVVDEFPNSLPPIKSISHHIDLVLGENLPNKETYRLTHQVNEEVKRQVQDLLDKGLVR
jgi:hypothetical protein